MQRRQYIVLQSPLWPQLSTITILNSTTARRKCHDYLSMIDNVDRTIHCQYVKKSPIVPSFGYVKTHIWSHFLGKCPFKDVLCLGLDEWMRSSLVVDEIFCLEWMRSSLVWMRSSLVCGWNLCLGLVCTTSRICMGTMYASTFAHNVDWLLLSPWTERTILYVRLIMYALEMWQMSGM